MSEYRNRIKAALDQLIKTVANPNDIVVIGYCFGGTGALEAARANLNVKGGKFSRGSAGRHHTQHWPHKSESAGVSWRQRLFVPEQQVKSFQDEMRKAGRLANDLLCQCHYSFTDPNAGNDPKKGGHITKWPRTKLASHARFFDEVLK